jgi:hypothetical protein
MLKKILICVISIFILWYPSLFIIDFIYYFYQGHLDYHKVKDEIPIKIMLYPGVKRAEVLNDEDYFEFTIAIYLENGGQLKLGNVSNNLRGSFRIERVGNYDLTRGIGFTNKELSFILGYRIHSVRDIVMKYDKVHSLLKTWPNFSDFRESPDESFYQIIEKNKNLIKTIQYKGETYLLFTYNWGDH